ncbi:MAG TPA: hypothetical protein VG712_04520 [Gemmatimonadales bacterium]|nr:hypothetical protein [Gemmatimonadales bacterium]
MPLPRRVGQLPRHLPACPAMGAQCRSLSVTLKVGGMEDGVASLDHEGTWLLGHTGQIDFGAPRVEGQDLLVEATLHLRCRHLKKEGSTDRCAAHGYARRTPPPPPRPEQPRQLGADRFILLEGLTQVTRVVRAPVPAKSSRALPVLAGTNPCLGAKCTTADHVRGAACCRDLQIEILCAEGDRELEALVRSRLSPYLCKIDRESPRSLGAEMISACGYLDDRGECSLHGRLRADGTTAKPDLCFDWPKEGKGEHPGCVFVSGRKVGG